MTRKTNYVVLVSSIFVILPVLIDQWLAAKYGRYEALRQQYECYPPPCSFDITGDKIPEKLVIQQPDPNKRFEWVLLLQDGDKELLRLPYDHTDNTFRTHMAIRPGPDGTHLLIYDGSAGPSNQTRSAYRWDGKQILAITPDQPEEEIIAAMAARDDTGTFHLWLIYQLARIPFYALLMLVMIVMGIIVFIKHRNKQRQTSIPQESR